MKKEYIVPQTEVIGIEYQGMLAYSNGSLGARELRDDFDSDCEDDYGPRELREDFDSDDYDE
jgi:hypothetical protein